MSLQVSVVAMELDSTKVIDSSASNKLKISNENYAMKLYEQRVSHLNFKWSIKKFSTLTSAYTKCISSPTFTSKSIPATWFLKHSPDSVGNNNKCARFYLCRAEKGAEIQVVVSYRIGVEVFYEIAWFPEKRNVLYGPGDEFYIDVIAREYFGNDNVLNQDTMNIVCEMYVKPLQADTIANKVINDLVYLSTDFQNCLAQAKFGDIELRVKDLKLLAHKAILSARSPIFAQARLSSHEHIVLADEDYDHMPILLTYMYSGNPYLALHNLCLCIGLFECAKKYHVMGLQRMLSPTDIRASTSAIDENEEFIWRLEGIRSLIADKLRITSRTFLNHSKIIPKCTLHIKSRSKNCLGIHINATQPINALYLKVAISILDKDMKEHFQQVMESTDELSVMLLFPYYVDKKELLRNPALLQNDQLIIKCKMEMTMRNEYLKQTETSSCPSYEEHFHSLSMDYERLLLEANLSDMSVLVDAKIFRLNKVFLAVRCPMLESKLKQEKGSECVNSMTLKPDLSPKVFSEMILYMYTGKISKKGPNSVIKLYEAAEVFNMKLLVNLCSRTLRSNIVSTSICDILTVAHTYEDVDLMTDCLNYVSKNKSEFFQSVEWKNLADNRSYIAMPLMQWAATLRLLN